jgi:hypothetical protein
MRKTTGRATEKFELGVGGVLSLVEANQLLTKAGLDPKEVRITVEPVDYTPKTNKKNKARPRKYWFYLEHLPTGARAGTCLFPKVTQQLEFMMSARRLGDYVSALRNQPELISTFLTAKGETKSREL